MKKLGILFFTFFMSIILLTGCEEHVHEYVLAPVDSLYHSSTCSCGEVVQEEHKFSLVEVVTEAGIDVEGKYKVKCDVCLYETIIKKAPLHAHTYSEQYKSDDASHWYECSCGDVTAKGEHSYGEWSVCEAATEEKSGVLERFCTTCNYRETKEEAMLEHTHEYGEWTIETAPTTYKKGKLVRVCQKNNSHVEEKEIPTLFAGDDYEYFVIKDSTCCNIGEGKYVYKIGANTFEFKVDIALKEHELAHYEPNNIINHKVKCACGYETFVEHVYEASSVKVEPTCSTEGIQVSKCKYCGYEKEETIAKVNHNLGALDITVEATCTNVGEGVRKCLDCDYEEKTSYEKLEHNLGQLDITVEATCTNVGEGVRKCLNCDYEEKTSYEKLEHNLGQLDITVEATCTNVGEGVRKCLDCGYEQRTSYEKLEHNLGVLDIVVEPTCTNIGEGVRKCLSCGYEERTSYEKLAHALTDVSIVEATCASDGLHIKKCINCEQEFKELLPRLTHIETDWIIVIEATCQESGLKIKNCILCDEVLEELEIEQLQHNPGEWVIVRENACNEEGLMELRCSVCNELVDSALTGKSEHILTDWQIVVEASCEEVGKQVKVCTECLEEVYSKSIEKLEHNQVLKKAKEPTCLEEGNTEGLYCDKCEKIFVGSEVIEKVDHVYEKGYCKWCKEAQKIIINYYDNEELVTTIEYDYNDKFIVYELEENEFKYVKGWYSVDGSTLYDESYQVVENLDVYAVWYEKIGISTAEELKAIKDNVSGDYYLKNDIDLVGEVWTPIDTFNGTFDGMNHVISNFELKTTSISSNYGFFKVNNGVIKNVILTDFNYSSIISSVASFTQGIFVGTNKGTLDNIYIKNAVVNNRTDNTNSSLTSNFGGIVGNNAGTISNCKIDGNINIINASHNTYQNSWDSNTYAYNRFGGVVGYNNGTIENTGSNIQASYTSYSAKSGKKVAVVENYVGALIGYNEGKVYRTYTESNIVYNYSGGSECSKRLYMGLLIGVNANKGIVNESFAKGKLDKASDAGNSIGGLVGQNITNSTIVSCYADVIINYNLTSNTSSNLGGLVGFNNASVKNSYALGEIIAASSACIGGLVGNNESAGIVSKSFAETALSSKGGTIGKCVGYSSGIVDKCYANKGEYYIVGDGTVEENFNSTSSVQEKYISDLVSVEFLRNELSWTDSWYMNGFIIPVLYWEVEQILDDSCEYENMLHDFEVSVTEPTCEMNGYSIIYCSHCDTVLITETFEPLGHDKVDHEKDKWIEPTHTTEGEKYYYCDECGEKWEEIIEATGHDELPADLSCSNLEYDEEKDAFYYICSCDDLVYVSDDLVVHDIINVDSVSPECGTLLPGLSVKVNESEEEKVFADLLLVKDLNYNDEGIRYSLVIEESYTNYIILNNGFASFELYDKEYNQYIGTFEYSVSEGTYVIDLITCENAIEFTIEDAISNVLIGEMNGYTGSEECDCCGKILSGHITIEPHYYKLVEIIKEQTCKEEGLALYKCVLCGHIKESIIEKNPHVYVDNELTCSVCELKKYNLEVTESGTYIIIDGDEDNKQEIIGISSIDDLKLLALYPNRNYYLLNDIILDNKVSLPICNEFNGILHGNGYSIDGLSIKCSDNGYFGLFNTIGTEGIIIDLTIKNVTIKVDNIENCIVGAFAAQNNGTIINSTLNTVTYDISNEVYSSNLVNKEVTFNYNIGGFVGINSGVLNSNKVEGNVKVNTSIVSHYNATFDGLLNLGRSAMTKNNTTIKFGLLAGLNSATIINSEIDCSIVTSDEFEAEKDGPSFGKAYLNVILYRGALVGYNEGTIKDCSSNKLQSAIFHSANEECYISKSGLSTNYQELMIKQYSVYEEFVGIIGHTTDKATSDVITNE